MSKFISRAYNTFEVNKLYGLVTKSSSNNKLRDEINYYDQIPKSLRIFFPRIIAPDNDKLVLEKYDYPNLGEYLMGEYSFNNRFDWRDTFSDLKEILKIWKLYTSQAVKEDAYEMYIAKTIREVENFSKQDIWPQLTIPRFLKINGYNMMNFRTMWPTIELYIERNLLPSYKSTFIHGDFCFANILCGPSGTLRFVDPRGSFGRKGCFGDQRYDVAKLYHSVDGNYEYLNSNKFNVNFSSDNCEYEIPSMTSIKGYLVDFFRETFFETKEFLHKDIMLIEGLIFVGSCARHYENPERQAALYMTGIERLNWALTNL